MVYRAAHLVMTRQTQLKLFLPYTNVDPGTCGIPAPGHLLGAEV